MERPTDLGLPAKFSSWRKGQDDAVIEAAVSLGERRFHVSSQPTGAGKSPYVMAVARLLGVKRTLVLTATKALQTQYITDFRPMGMVEIKGQANYRCLAVARPSGQPGVGELHGMAPEKSQCDDGPCHAGAECSLRAKGCYYFDATRAAGKSDIVTTNYSYWMHALKFGDAPIGEFDLLVLDEAHAAPDKLAEFVSIYLSRRELRDLLDTTLPRLDAGTEYWAAWAKKWWLVATAMLKDMKLDRGSSARVVREMRNLATKLEDLALSADWKRGNPGNPDVWVPGASTDWVAEESDNGATFSPVWAQGYAERFLFANIPRVLLVSATIVPKTVSYLGVSPDEFKFDERKSSFPVERRPIYVTGNIKVRYGMSRGEELAWMNKIDSILATRLDRKVIIHAVSYDRARFIVANSRYGKDMILHGTTDMAHQINRFRMKKAPAILVSPSVREGYDFPYDECEVQIIAKVPFVNMTSEVVKARRKHDKRYTDYLAVMALVQSAGRGMRAVDDMCETFIVDASVGWLIARNRELMPKWFRMAIKRVDMVPAAPKKVGVRE